MAGLLTPPQEMQQPQQAPQQGMQQEQMPPEEVSEDESPQFGQAMQFIYAALYENDAGRQILKGIQKAPDKAEALANFSYETAYVATEKVPDLPVEDYLLLGMMTLTEVVEICEAAGLKLSATDVAFAQKTMILRLAAEAGTDPAKLTELQKAMDQYTPEMIDEAVKYAGGEEGETQPEEMAEPGGA